MRSSRSTRWWLAAAVFLLAACSSHAGSKPSRTTGAPFSSGSAAQPSSSEPTGESIARDRVEPPRVRELTLTWVVHPALLDGRGIAHRHVELVARAGAYARRIPIDARGSVAFAIEMQPLCAKNGAASPLPRRAVA